MSKKRKVPRRSPKIKRAVTFLKKERWKSRPRWKQWYLPYTTLVLEDGTPNFQAIDSERVLDCITNYKCGVCGQSLLVEDRWAAFIGGERCAESYAFIDPAMHPECAYYAAKTCPYLKNEEGKYSKTINAKHPPGTKLILLDEADKSEGRPKRMMILFAKGYRMQISGNTTLIIARREGSIIDWNAMPESK